jgi:carboxyl-terminal processing protease
MGALGLIRRTALFSDTVDWGAVHGDAEAVLREAGCYADTRVLLATVLARAGGRHSSLRAPQHVREIRDRAAAALGSAVPAGQVIDGAGYLRLPRLPGRWRLAARDVTAGGGLLAAMTAARPRGWIVDLRDNAGGNMWPMLAVAAALLDDGPLGYCAVPGGRCRAWSLDRGCVRLDGRRLARAAGPFLRDGHPPIAVLTSGRTASAGEAVAIAFRGQPGVRVIGTPTAGFTTGNQTYHLRDGMRLSITGCYYAGRDRRPVTGPFPVDHDVGDADADCGASVAAALSWIRGQG